MIHEHDTLANTMTRVEAESQIITSAFERLKAVQPIQVVNLRREVRVGDRRWDGEVTLKTQRGTFQYIFEVKHNLRPQTIQHLLIQAESSRKQWGKSTELLLLADYVNPSLGDQLKNTGINFIDTAGNLFLKRDPGLFLYVEGKKPLTSRKEKPTRLFQPSGLALLFGFLVEPQSVNHPYRQLSEANGVALGTVGWVKRDLREQGYLESIGKDSFRLIRKKDLIDRWVHGYTARLRPKMFLGEFRDLNNDLKVVVEEFRRYALEHWLPWGLSGGYGADKLIHHYRGNTLTLFVESWQHNDALRELKWLPVAGGPITVLKSFSPRIFKTSKDKGHCPVVHPLLLYAELLNRGTDREMETARLIYQEFMEDSLAKD